MTGWFCDRDKPGNLDGLHWVGFVGVDVPVVDVAFAAASCLALHPSSFDFVWVSSVPEQQRPPQQPWSLVPLEYSGVLFVLD